MTERFYFNQGRCARLNLVYDIYDEAVVENKELIEVETTNFVSVVYELDDEQYTRALYKIIIPALKGRKFHLFFTKVPFMPGYFDVSLKE